MSHVVRALSPWFGPRVEKLGTAEIVRAAVALADGVDLEAVSMRALAKRPGGEAMSLYRHMVGKAALIDAMVD